MGGSIIILVVSYLTFNIIFPPLLNAFFGLFVGAIQAFVFTMLTLVYISVQVK
jgi:F-type H+-transporting ATPase subunit a